MNTSWMNISILLAVSFGLTYGHVLPRAKREAYALPYGAEVLVGHIRTSFACFGDGYYADIDNHCKIFHVCHTAIYENGKHDSYQWSFVCGNQTVFNQLTFTCAHPEDAVPCENARDFYYLNANLLAGDPDVHFLGDHDIMKAEPLISGEREMYQALRYRGM